MGKKDEYNQKTLYEILKELIKILCFFKTSCDLEGAVGKVTLDVSLCIQNVLPSGPIIL